MMKNRIPTNAFATVRKCQKRVPIIPDVFKSQVMAWPRSAEALVHLKSLNLKTTELHEFIFEADAKLEVPVTSWGIVNKEGAIRSENGTYVTVGKKAEPAQTPAPEKAAAKPKEVKEKAATPKKKAEPKAEETKA
jgi:hypothetical protein